MLEKTFLCIYILRCVPGKKLPKYPPPRAKKPVASPVPHFRNFVFPISFHFLPFIIFLHLRLTETLNRSFSKETILMEIASRHLQIYIMATDIHRELMKIMGSPHHQQTSINPALRSHQNI